MERYQHATSNPRGQRSPFQFFFNSFPKQKNKQILSFLFFFLFLMILVSWLAPASVLVTLYTRPLECVSQLRSVFLSFRKCYLVYTQSSVDRSFGVEQFAWGWLKDTEPRTTHYSMLENTYHPLGSHTSGIYIVSANAYVYGSR